MISKLALFACLLTAIHGHSLVQNSRQGNLNSYLLYTRIFNNGITPIRMPTPNQFEEAGYGPIQPFHRADPNTPELDQMVTAPKPEVFSRRRRCSVANILIPELKFELPTIVVVHGHGEDSRSTFVTDIIGGYFHRLRPDYQANIIVVDWSAYTKQSYSLSSSAVASVGVAVRDYLKLLIDQGRIDLTKLHLVGFNLGAHVVGFTGRSLNGVVPRITGLDPAGSGWGSRSPRLTKADAVYVEIIHTDGDGTLSNGVGTATGDVDFFMNGGSNQPGCVTHACSHRRAYEVFVASLVRENPILGYPCTSNLQLSLNRCSGRDLDVGGDALSKLHGENNVYRANTGRTFPF